MTGQLLPLIFNQGQQHYEEQQRQRSIAALGFQINPTPVPARNRPSTRCFP